MKVRKREVCLYKQPAPYFGVITVEVDADLVCVHFLLSGDLFVKVGIPTCKYFLHNSSLKLIILREERIPIHFQVP